MVRRLMSLSGFSGREDAQVGSDNAQRPGSEGGAGMLSPWIGL